MALHEASIQVPRSEVAKLRGQACAPYVNKYFGITDAEVVSSQVKSIRIGEENAEVKVIFKSSQQDAKRATRFGA